MPADPGQATLVRQLWSKGLCGLAIQTGYYLESIPPLILAQAEELNFPVIKLPKEASFAAITKAVLQRLVNRQFELLAYSRNIYERLTDLVLTNAEVVQIARVLADLIKRSVCILDPEHQSLALAPRSPGGNPLAAVNWEEELAEFARTGLLKQIPNQKQPVHLPATAGRPALLLTPVMIGNEVHGYIAVVAESPLSEMDAVATGHAATVLALLFTKEKAVAAAQAKAQGDFFDDLLTGNFGSAEAVAKRAGYLGLNPISAYTVMIIDVDDFEAYASTCSEQEIQRLKEGLYDTARNVIRSMQQDTVLKMEGDSIVAFLPVESAAPPGALHQLAEKVQRSLRQRFPRITTSIGIGQVCPDLATIGDCYREARQVLRVVRLTGQKAIVATYQELALYHLLLAMAENRELTGQFFRHTVEPLFKYDATRGGDLVKTLRVYLQSGMNKQETAKNLFVHRHTLRYRLQRITELTGKDPCRTRDRLELELGLLVAQLLFPAGFGDLTGLGG